MREMAFMNCVGHFQLSVMLGKESGNSCLRDVSFEFLCIRFLCMTGRGRYGFKHVISKCKE